MLKARNNTEIISVKAFKRRSFFSRLSSLISSTNVLSDTIFFLPFCYSPSTLQIYPQRLPYAYHIMILLPGTNCH